MWGFRVPRWGSGRLYMPPAIQVPLAIITKPLNIHLSGQPKGPAPPCHAGPVYANRSNWV